MKVLLIILQPRIIPEFLECVAKIKVDKLWLKYYDLQSACDISRDYFLNKTDYTHAAFVTDDIIFTQEHFDILKQDVEKWNYNIISGWSNGNLSFGANDSNLSLHLPPENPHKVGNYSDYQFMTIADVEASYQYEKIFEVKHSGLMLTFLSRKIIQDIPFRTDYGCCRDAMFSHDLHKKGIRQYIDLRVRLKHLKRDDTIWWPLEVGKRPAKTVFEYAKQ